MREGSAGLKSGQMFASYRWNYFEADDLYKGKDRQSHAEDPSDVRNVQNEHTIGFEVGIIERLSAVLEVPFQVNKRSLDAGAVSGGLVMGQVEQTSAGLADMRALLRYWFLPEDLIPGNFAFEAGVKAPTGEEALQNDGYFNDVSIQTGTGSWDALFGLHGFLRFGSFVPRASVRYLMTPKETNGTPAFHEQLIDPNTDVVNSVPDQVSWRAGIGIDAGHLLRRQFTEEERGLLDRFRISLDITGSHVLKEDLIGGSDGFRRAVDAIFFEPGIEWGLSERFSVFAGVPITLYRYLSTEPGTFPAVQFNLGLAFAIN